MNQADYAARHGVSRKTVTDWKKRGWLVFSGDEIEPEASDAMLRKYRKGGSMFDAASNTDSLPAGEVTAKLTESVDVLPAESNEDNAVSPSVLGVEPTTDSRPVAVGRTKANDDGLGLRLVP